jgi:hypothetical protein
MPNPAPGGFAGGLERVSRNRKIAEAIAGQSFDSPQTQMVGSGPYQIAVQNPYGPISQIAKALIGQRGIKQADTEEQALRTGRRDEVAKAMTTYWPALQDPNASPEQRQAAAAGMMGTLEPEDMRAASSQILKSALDPREVSARRVAQVTQGIDKEWRGRRPLPGGPQPGQPRLTPTGGEGEAQALPMAMDMPPEAGGTQGEAIPMGMDQGPMGMGEGEGEAMPVADYPVQEAADSESPEYYQFAAQKLEAAGLPREAEKMRKEQAKAEKEKRKENFDTLKLRRMSENQLMGHYQSMAKPYHTMASYATNIERASQDKTGSSDLALVYSFMHMLDPLSTVMPSEYAAATKTVGTLDQLQAMVEKIKSGAFLGDEARANFLKTTRSIMSASSEKQKFIDDQFKGIAKREGYQPGNIIVRPIPELPEKAAAPRPAQPAAKPAPGKPVADPLGIR